ncbi:STAR9 protein, partial [Atractosteus spatula]|nr:STAR9 protein [Atractosteus spatula]
MHQCPVHTAEKKQLSAHKFLTSVPVVLTQLDGRIDGLGDSREKLMEFGFDYCYWSVDPEAPDYASQEVVFRDLGAPVLAGAAEGYNVCLFAYGQTGSGKTYTMIGTPTSVGLTPRICEGLFTRDDRYPEGQNSCRVEISFLEIYNERVRDLLRRPEQKKPFTLRVREHPEKGPYVQGLSQHVVSDYKQAVELLEEGIANRITAATHVHDASSRSHAIFTIHYTQAILENNLPSEIVSKINLVDLAGSERADPQYCRDRITEGSNINKSLVTLGIVISSLAQNSQMFSSCQSINSVASEGEGSTAGSHSSSHSGGGRRSCYIPYRDSVLTWLLKDSLGGNSKTIMIATVSPSSRSYSETLSTLRYAAHARNIVNKPRINEDANVKLIRELREEIDRLKAISALLLQQRNPSPSFSEDRDGNLSDIVLQNELKIEQLTKDWSDKWRDRQELLEQYRVDINRDRAGVQIDSHLPHLIALEGDILSTGVTLYHLREGVTRIGSNDEQDEAHIVLQGPAVDGVCCEIVNEGGVVTLRPVKGCVCVVNEREVTEPSRLAQGAVIVLGGGHRFRFNHPAEAAILRQRRQTSEVFLSSRELLPHHPETRPSLPWDRAGGGGCWERSKAGAGGAPRRRLAEQQRYVQSLREEIQVAQRRAERDLEWEQAHLQQQHRDNQQWIRQESHRLANEERTTSELGVQTDPTWGSEAGVQVMQGSGVCETPLGKRKKLVQQELLRHHALRRSEFRVRRKRLRYQLEKIARKRHFLEAKRELQRLESTFALSRESPTSPDLTTELGGAAPLLRRHSFSADLLSRLYPNQTPIYSHFLARNKSTELPPPSGRFKSSALRKWLSEECLPAASAKRMRNCSETSTRGLGQVLRCEMGSVGNQKSQQTTPPCPDSSKGKGRASSKSSKTKCQEPTRSSSKVARISTKGNKGLERIRKALSQSVSPGIRTALSRVFRKPPTGIFINRGAKSVKKISCKLTKSLDSKTADKCLTKMASCEDLDHLSKPGEDCWHKRWHSADFLTGGIRQGTGWELGDCEENEEERSSDSDSMYSLDSLSSAYTKALAEQLKQEDADQLVQSDEESIDSQMSQDSLVTNGERKQSERPAVALSNIERCSFFGNLYSAAGFNAKALKENAFLQQMKPLFYQGGETKEETGERVCKLRGDPCLKTCSSPANWRTYSREEESLLALTDAWSSSETNESPRILQDTNQEVGNMVKGSPKRGAELPDSMSSRSHVVIPPLESNTEEDADQKNALSQEKYQESPPVNLALCHSEIQQVKEKVARLRTFEGAQKAVMKENPKEQNEKQCKILQSSLDRTQVKGEAVSKSKEKDSCKSKELKDDSMGESNKQCKPDPRIVYTTRIDGQGSNTSEHKAPEVSHLENTTVEFRKDSWKNPVECSKIKTNLETPERVNILNCCTVVQDTQLSAEFTGKDCMVILDSTEKQNELSECSKEDMPRVTRVAATATTSDSQKSDPTSRPDSLLQKIPTDPGEIQDVCGEQCRIQSEKEELTPTKKQSSVANPENGNKTLKSREDIDEIQMMINKEGSVSGLKHSRSETPEIACFSVDQKISEVVKEHMDCLMKESKEDIIHGREEEHEVVMVCSKVSSSFRKNIEGTLTRFKSVSVHTAEGNTSDEKRSIEGTQEFRGGTGSITEWERDDFRIQSKPEPEESPDFTAQTEFDRILKSSSYKCFAKYGCADMAKNGGECALNSLEEGTNSDDSFCDVFSNKISCAGNLLLSSKKDNLSAAESEVVLRKENLRGAHRKSQINSCHVSDLNNIIPAQDAGQDLGSSKNREEQRDKENRDELQSSCHITSVSCISSEQFPECHIHNSKESSSSPESSLSLSEESSLDRPLAALSRHGAQKHSVDSCKKECCSLLHIHRVSSPVISVTPHEGGFAFETSTNSHQSSRIVCAQSDSEANEGSCVEHNAQREHKPSLILTGIQRTSLIENAQLSTNKIKDYTTVSPLSVSVSSDEERKALHCCSKGDGSDPYLNHQGQNSKSQDQGGVHLPVVKDAMHFGSSDINPFVHPWQEKEANRVTFKNQPFGSVSDFSSQSLDCGTQGVTRCCSVDNVLNIQNSPFHSHLSSFANTRGISSTLSSMENFQRQDTFEYNHRGGSYPSCQEVLDSGSCSIGSGDLGNSSVQVDEIMVLYSSEPESTVGSCKGTPRLTCEHGTQTSADCWKRKKKRHKRSSTQVPVSQRVPEENGDEQPTSWASLQNMSFHLSQLIHNTSDLLGNIKNVQVKDASHLTPSRPKLFGAFSERSRRDSSTQTTVDVGIQTKKIFKSTSKSTKKTVLAEERTKPPEVNVIVKVIGSEVLDISQENKDITLALQDQEKRTAVKIQSMPDLRKSSSAVLLPETTMGAVPLSVRTSTPSLDTVNQNHLPFSPRISPVTSPARISASEDGTNLEVSRMTSCSSQFTRSDNQMHPRENSVHNSPCRNTSSRQVCLIDRASSPILTVEAGVNSCMGRSKSVQCLANHETSEQVFIEDSFRQQKRNRSNYILDGHGKKIVSRSQCIAHPPGCQIGNLSSRQSRVSSWSQQQSGNTKNLALSKQKPAESHLLSSKLEEKPRRKPQQFSGPECELNNRNGEGYQTSSEDGERWRSPCEPSEMSERAVHLQDDDTMSVAPSECNTDVLLNINPLADDSPDSQGNCRLPEDLPMHNKFTNWSGVHYQPPSSLNSSVVMGPGKSQPRKTKKEKSGSIASGCLDSREPKDERAREIERLRKERAQVMAAVRLDLNPHQLTVELTEAKLNYGLGETDTLLKLLHTGAAEESCPMPTKEQLYDRHKKSIEGLRQERETQLQRCRRARSLSPSKHPFAQGQGAELLPKDPDTPSRHREYLQQLRQGVVDSTRVLQPKRLMAQCPSEIELLLRDYGKAREEAKTEIARARDRLRKRTEQEKKRLQQQALSQILRDDLRFRTRISTSTLCTGSSLSLSSGPTSGYNSSNTVAPIEGTTPALQAAESSEERAERVRGRPTVRGSQCPDAQRHWLSARDVRLEGPGFENSAQQPLVPRVRERTRSVSSISSVSAAYQEIAACTVACAMAEIRSASEGDLGNLFSGKSLGGWKYQGLEQGVLVYYKPFSSPSMHGFLGAAVIKQPLYSVWCMIRDHSKTHLYHRAVRTAQATRLDSTTQLVYVVMDTSVCYLKQPRDFCCISAEDKQEGQFVLAMRSVYDESLPRPGTEMVRGELLPSAWVLQPHTRGGKEVTRVIYMTQVRPPFSSTHHHIRALNPGFHRRTPGFPSC